MLSNILLDDLDKELERREHNFCRYADDVNIYVGSRRAGERVLDSIERFLDQRLRLQVNRQKSAVDRPWKRKFLGYSLTWHKRPRLKVAPSSLERLKRELKKIFRQGRGRNLGQADRGVDPDPSGVGELLPSVGSAEGVSRSLTSGYGVRLRWHDLATVEADLDPVQAMKARGLEEVQAWKSATNGHGSWWNSGASHMNEAFPKRLFDQIGAALHC